MFLSKRNGVYYLGYENEVGTRQECLNQHWFLSLEDANAKLTAWQNEYNSERPHSALGYRTPLESRTKSSNAEANAA